MNNTTGIDEIVKLETAFNNTFFNMNITPILQKGIGLAIGYNADAAKTFDSKLKITPGEKTVAKPFDLSKSADETNSDKLIQIVNATVSLLNSFGGAISASTYNPDAYLSAEHKYSSVKKHLPSGIIGVAVYVVHDNMQSKYALLNSVEDAKQFAEIATTFSKFTSELNNTGDILNSSLLKIREPFKESTIMLDELKIARDVLINNVALKNLFAELKNKDKQNIYESFNSELTKLYEGTVKTIGETQTASVTEVNKVLNTLFNEKKKYVEDVNKEFGGDCFSYHPLIVFNRKKAIEFFKYVNKEFEQNIAFWEPVKDLLSKRLNEELEINDLRLHDIDVKFKYEGNDLLLSQKLNIAEVSKLFVYSSQLKQ